MTHLEALKRADKLVELLMKNIGGIAPGDYKGNLYADLNEHGLYMEQLAREERAAKSGNAL